MNVLITGASSGIGAALATEMARRGHRVGLLARRAPLLEDLAFQIQASGGSAAWRMADVVDQGGLAAAIAEIEAELGGPTDIIVANAGRGMPARGWEFTADRVHTAFALNVGGVANTFSPVLPAMLERGSGQLVAVSSVAGWSGLAPGAVYSASKAAVTTLLDGLRVDLLPRGIAVTTVHPGFVETPIIEGAEFDTPFTVPVERAARIIADGILARKRAINFPWQIVWLMRLARALPRWAVEPLLRRFA